MSGAVAVSGLAGASPELLAASLRGVVDDVVVLGDGVAPPSGVQAAILALDLSIAVGSAERMLLARLETTGAPVALVGVGAGADGDWPARLTAARGALDAHHRLPLFAISAELLAVPGAAGSGVDAVREWCAAPGPPTRPMVKSPAGPEPRPWADSSAVRAERAAGARAGLAELRGRMAADLRAGASTLSTTAQTATERLGRGDVEPFMEWLWSASAVYRDRITAELAEGLDHVRSVAMVGLPEAVGAPSSSVTIGVTVPRPSGPLGRPSAEDLVVLALGASAGLGVGRMVVAPLAAWAGLGAAATVLTVCAGLAAAAAVVSARRRTALRAQVRAAAAEAVGALRAALEHAVVAQLGAAQAQLSRDLRSRAGASSPAPVTGDGASARGPHEGRDVTRRDGRDGKASDE